MEPNNTFITTGGGGAAYGEGIVIGGKGGDVITNIYGPGALMSLPRARYARHDSGRQDAPSSCLEGTRVAILAEIMLWLENANGESPPIYWLSGLAGIGKSTIAKTVADRAQERDMLGASYFFSRGDGPLRDPQLVFPTVAFQLAQSDDALKNVIIEAVQQDVTLGDQKLLPQFQGLILAPLLKINANRRPTLIVLDALDECEERGAAEILRLLFSHGTRIPFLRVLITSRPEPHISSVFDEALNHAKRVLHDIEASVIQEDIRLYLHTELTQIPRKLRLRLGANWASEDEIHSLVDKSGKLFVYAATSIRFIGDNRVRDPRRQLSLILSTQTAQKVGATPYTQLDNLYLGVLRNSLSDSNRQDILERFQVVVGSIILLREPLPLDSLAQFVQYDMDKIDTALYYLRSVIIVPSNDYEAPRIHHPSFRDFIMDASRCSETGFVIVPVPDQERRHAIRCFELLSEFLKRNVAGISDPSLLNSEVDGFEQKVRHALSPEVQYACRYWASHLSCVEFGDELVVGALDGFSMRSILWWFEAMSLMGSISTAASSVQEARHWAMSSKCELTLVTMLADAHRFILAHAEVIRASALHVYESALPFTPHDSVLYKTYCEEAKDSIRVLQGVVSKWPQNLSCLRGHSRVVTCVAYSPDGLRLASSSWDCSVRLWDATSGAPIATLAGHSDWVHSVAFSPDGLRLISGSKDHSVRLWDAMSGTSIATLEGHSREVHSVAFSPDGLRLASGSDDGSIRLWDAMSGMPIATLEGHSHSVMCVAYSLDGLRLASGSWDRSVRLWDATSGAPIAILKSHSDCVNSVAFSPDGLRLASASRDRSIRLWDAMSGTSIATLEGHSELVRPITLLSVGFSSVGFSPDGLRLASGSDKHSIQLWDAMSGMLIATLEGHSSLVNSVAFSPDGLRLASGSTDHSVRLWDPLSTRGTPVGTLDSHSATVCSVAFSPDGLRLASGSTDHTVRLWDAMSGAPIATLQGHSGSVSSIAFSPDGLRLASCSRDRSTRLWDAVSGASIATLQGHSDVVRSAVFSPDGFRVASCSDDHSVRLWDPVSGAPIATLKGHSRPVRSVTFSPNGLQLASRFTHLSVRLWDATSGAPIATLEDSMEPVEFSPDGLRLASRSKSHALRLWDAMSGAPIATLQGHSDWVLSITFSPDGLRLASGSKDRSVQLWDAISGVLIATLEGHSTGVRSVAFSIDAQTLISRSNLETFVWDLTLHPPCHQSPMSSVEFYSSSRSLPFLWSYNGQWIQVPHRLENRLRHICYIPPFYTRSTRVVTNLRNCSRIAIGCDDGRVIFLNIPSHIFST